MSFLKLPAELRLQVYALIAGPLYTPFSDYAGLYLSCKQVKTELQQEGTREISRHIAAIAAATPGIAITVPATIPSLHLTITLDVGLHPYANRTRLAQDVTSFLHLHLTTLTICVVHSTSNPLIDAGKQYSWLEDAFRDNRRALNAQRVILGINFYTSRFAHVWARLDSHVESRGQGGGAVGSDRVSR